MGFTKILFSVLLITIYSVLSAQSIEWQQKLGGSNDDRANSIIQTSDGGFIVAGQTRSDDGDIKDDRPDSCNYTPCNEFWVVRLNSNGDTIWTKVLGGSGHDSPNSIKQTNDGGYVLAGETDSDDGDISGHQGLQDFWVVKLTPTGDTAWTKALGGSNDDKAQSIQQTSDGGYVVAGETYSDDGHISGHHGSYDFWVVKLTPTGDTVWTKALGGSDDDEAQSIQQTRDGGYIVAGHTKSEDGDIWGSNINICSPITSNCYDYWITKLNSTGDTLWTRTLGRSRNDLCYSIQQTFDDGYIVAGETFIDDGFSSINAYYFISKLNNSGDTLWTKILGGSATDVAYSIRQTSDSGYIVTGYTKSEDQDVWGSKPDSCNNPPCNRSDYWIVKLNNNGDTVWTRTYGGSHDDQAYSIQQASDGGYILAGGTESNNGDVTDPKPVSCQTPNCLDFWVVKLAPTDTSCNPKSSSISTTACQSYTVPSGDETYTSGGTYSDTVLTPTDCDSIITINLTIPKLDDSVSITTNTLTANDSSASYQWLNCDSNISPVNGATNQSFTPNSNGKYAVALTKRGCTDTSQCYNITNVGVGANQSDRYLNLYPNPTTSNLKLKLQLAKRTNFRIQVFDVLGQSAFTRTITERKKYQTNLDFEDNATGIYFVRITLKDGKSMSRKVIVNR